MNTPEYVVGLVLIVLVVILAVITPLFLVHARGRDHGPDCWWCHPRLRRR
ncbi:hypothetical protein GCM10010441_44710 [Kitasatospora paracochleata]|uniref:Uncharacterized protein n=1 Tax=Kitasatospora paracochleata TaxID=58354 RepID=A0ABT1J9B9_9ACTN|nr:hypothetical protein [Kitasatospora paracochleata]MCP2314048.1 hypothetical protein [Kitasatospora paracochleata]